MVSSAYLRLLIFLLAIFSVIERLAFDPHGKRRHPDGSEATSMIPSRTPRGYTGHEMDDEALFINMNARLYDPILGRFISADPIVPQAGDSQAYNRYSYVDSVGILPTPELNTYLYARANPLRYTDPLGLWSISVGYYAPWGGEVIFGRDPISGGGFLTGRFGFGVGGGIQWSKSGGRPGARAEECDTGGIGIGGYGDIGGNIGPLNAALTSNAGVNFNNRGGANTYGELFTPTWSIGDSWGIKAAAAIGGEVTLYSPKDPLNPGCGCRR